MKSKQRTLKRPRSHKRSELRRAGVEIRWLEKRMKCDNCGTEWEFTYYKARLPRGYWKCPNGCNEAAV